MMERFFNLLFSVSSLWGRSRDPFLNELRSYQRGMLVGFIGFLFFAALSLFVLPDANQSGPRATIIGEVQALFSMVPLGLGLICLLVAAYNLYRYIRFTQE